MPLERGVRAIRFLGFRCFLKIGSLKSGTTCATAFLDISGRLAWNRTHIPASGSSDSTCSTHACRAADGAYAGTGYLATSGGRRRNAVAGWSVGTDRGSADGGRRAVSRLLAYSRSVGTHPAWGFGRCTGDARTWRMVRGRASVRAEAD